MREEQGEFVFFSMRWLLIISSLLFSVISFAGNPEPKLTIDTSGTASICLSRNNIWRVTLQQFRWNKWVFVRQIEIYEPMEKDTCVTFPVDLHSGQNRFRIQMKDHDKVITNCCQVSLTHTIATPAYEEMTHYGIGDTIHLENWSMWELYDMYGNLVWQGKSKDIPLRGLETGEYYFCYDNLIKQIAVFPEEHKIRKE
jgi:hypothetical protein